MTREWNMSEAFRVGERRLTFQDWAAGKKSPVLHFKKPGRECLTWGAKNQDSLPPIKRNKHFSNKCHPQAPRAEWWARHGTWNAEHHCCLKLPLTDPGGPGPRTGTRGQHAAGRVSYHCHFAAKPTLLRVTRQPGWEGGLAENGCMRVYGWVPLPSTWDHHYTVNQLCSNTKQEA